MRAGGLHAEKEKKMRKRRNSLINAYKKKKVLEEEEGALRRSGLEIVLPGISGHGSSKNNFKFEK